MCFLWSRRAVGQGEAGHWRNMCPGSARGTVPFCPRKHQQCSRSGILLRADNTTRACHQSIRGQETSLGRVEEVWPRTETRINSTHFHLLYSKMNWSSWSENYECDAFISTTIPAPSIHQPPLPPLPISLNQASQSAFPLPIPEHWLIVRHFTTHPL